MFFSTGPMETRDTLAGDFRVSRYRAHGPQGSKFLLTHLSMDMWGRALELIGITP